MRQDGLDPKLGEVVLVDGIVWTPGIPQRTSWHAAIVCDVRAINIDGTFRAVVFRFGGSSECFDLKSGDLGKTWTRRSEP